MKLVEEIGEVAEVLNRRDGITMTWQRGRQLASYSDNDTSVSYTYDANGMRTGKTVTTDSSSVEWEYTYNGGQLVQMKRGDVTLDFSYDANGNPVSFSYRSSATSTPTEIYFQSGFTFRLY